MAPDTGGPPRVGLFHRVFDRFYPAIRFTYERGMGHEWFSEVTPQLWLGGAPTYGRDFDEILALGITGIVDMRAEREAEAAFFAEHDIALRQYFVPDVTVPGEEILTDAVEAITAWVGEGRTVLIHCAKGRGRSATVLAAYLMKTEGMSFDEVSEFLTRKRALVKLQDRHRVVLESWIAKQEPAVGPEQGPDDEPASES
jgi:protein tyrosine phosphatase (PTP) superfamily phosphohydrolase (DUF442 family)